MSLMGNSSNYSPTGNTSNSNQIENANFISNPFYRNNDYGWRHNPKFAYNQNQGQSSGPSKDYILKRQPDTPQYQSSNHMQEMMAQIIDTMQALQKNMESRATSQDASIRNLERQLGQMAAQLTGRTPGSLPSNTEKNPRGEEQNRP